MTLDQASHLLGRLKPLGMCSIPATTKSASPCSPQTIWTKKPVNLEMRNLQPLRLARVEIPGLLIRTALGDCLQVSRYVEPGKTHSPNEWVCAFGRDFTKCAAPSKFPLPIIEKRFAKPPVRAHEPAISVLQCREN